MSDLWKQWAIVQRYPAPTCDKHPEGGPITCGWKHAYRELVAALPRPIRVRHHCRGRFDLVGWECRLCPERAFITGWSTPDALAAGLAHLHRNHGCPSWQVAGEPCTDACQDCRGWGWRA